MKKKLYRQYVERLAARVARALGIPKPHLIAIRGKRGRAYFGSGYTLPEGIFHRHPAYRDYYIAHEVCHFVPGANHHGTAFWKNEQLLAEARGHRLIFPLDGKSPYPVEIRELDTGHPICDQYGRCVI